MLLHRERKVVDLFAGPGGWSEGLKALGHTELGIELDESACATARAAGHERLQDNVASLRPYDFPCDGLIASPPCQAWSMAGKGGGRRDVEHVIACALEIAAGNDTRLVHGALCEDPRSMLVVEPLRWTLALKPRWIAMEQVPPVLELWTLFAQILEQHGYSTWAGVLEAERYGVPQTRERAILMAHRERPVSPPRATHQRYVPGEPQRHDVTFDGEILPWVSMAEALGWGMTARPCVTVAAGSGRQGGPSPLDGGSGARATLRNAQEAGEWAYDRRQGTTRPDGARDMVRPIPIDEPAPTIASDGLRKGRDVWVHERPATAVCADPRISPPGWRGNPEDYKRPEGPTRSGDNAVRVTVQQAAILQSFRPDYPWQGSRSKQFEQVGNAVPPLLARAVLSQLVEPIPMEKAA